MLSWFTTRVFMFPAFVIRSTLFESMVRQLLHGQPLWLGGPPVAETVLGLSARRSAPRWWVLTSSRTTLF